MMVSRDKLITEINAKWAELEQGQEGRPNGHCLLSEELRAGSQWQTRCVRL